MLNVTVIGSGNVAQHLINAFAKADSVNIAQAFARNAKNLAHLLPAEKIISNLSELKETDVYIIAVADNAIAEISAQLLFDNKLVVHTSGSMPMEELNATNRRGVLYPLQTFSKDKALDFRNIPICLESESAEDYEVLVTLAGTISGSIYNVDSGQRKALHVAAVFASNFTNHMYTMASDICNEHSLPFDILKPLIAETAAKVQELEPAKAQTGPAIRHDSKTIAAHLEMLSDEQQKNIYKAITQAIQAHAEKL
ncbi:MAG: Rossmann-like and DUF2520 domain-containing protein [Flavobacterium sp.]